MSNRGPLPIPGHFDPATVGEVRRVPYQQRASEAAEWARIHHVAPAVEDRIRICLLAVDCQNTFCIPGFELFVGGRSGNGAVEDNVRLCEFIYRNLGVITEIRLTMDSHKVMQIFHPAFWVDENGKHPAPMTIITVEDVESGAWMVNPAATYAETGRSLEEIRRYAVHYVRELRAREKYSLTIWPYHAMLGGIGHALVSAVEEAVFFHGVARHGQGRFEIKGDRILTEHYSVLCPEVLTDERGDKIAEKNVEFIEQLWDFDAVIIAGQAKSHCVAWTVDNLLDEIQAKDPALAGRIHLLEDCTSPVVVPGVADFTEDADKAFRKFADAGMHVVRSVDPIDTWPGMPR
jgi:nicotinamidase-related amidase